MKDQIVKKLQHQEAYSKTKTSRKLKRNLEKSAKASSALLDHASLDATADGSSNHAGTEAVGACGTSIPGTDVDDFNLRRSLVNGNKKQTTAELLATIPHYLEFSKVSTI